MVGIAYNEQDLGIFMELGKNPTKADSSLRAPASLDFDEFLPKVLKPNLGSW